jgi:hypothetical protein
LGFYVLHWVRLAAIHAAQLTAARFLHEHTVMHSEAPSSPSSPSGENGGNDRPDGNGNQSAHQDLLTGESSFDVEKMTQQGCG